MKAGCTSLILGFLVLAMPGVAQNETPSLLHRLLHCAMTDASGALYRPLRPTDVLQAAWSRSTHPKDDAGEFFLVVYESSSKGDVYVFTRDYQQGKTVLNLVNNARFTGGPTGLNLIDPLGGIWTYEHIERNVKRAMRGKRYSIPAGSLLGSSPAFACHHYWDRD
jgi:hypothetical protein